MTAIIITLNLFVLAVNVYTLYRTRQYENELQFLWLSRNITKQAMLEAETKYRENTQALEDRCNELQELRWRVQK